MKTRTRIEKTLTRLWDEASQQGDIKKLATLRTLFERFEADTNDAPLMVKGLTRPQVERCLDRFPEADDILDHGATWVIFTSTDSANEVSQDILDRYEDEIDEAIAATNKDLSIAQEAFTAKTVERSCNITVEKIRAAITAREEGE